MKLLLALGLIIGAYTFFMLRTTDIVAGQAQYINTAYQYVAGNAGRIATGR